VRLKVRWQEKLVEIALCIPLAGVQALASLQFLQAEAGRAR
jgi:hypothetical protein